MPHDRYYLDSSLQPGDVVSLQGNEWHHLAHVLRGKKGDRVELINGKGRLVHAGVEEIRKTEGSLVVEDLLQDQPPPPPVILALAFSRMNHLEWAVEKATELGASAFWLFPGELSEKTTLSEHQQTRLQALILAATKQCGRLHLPDLQGKPPLSKWAPLKGSLFVCDTSPEAPYLWSLLAKEPLIFPVVFFVGPEKGFSPQELSFLKQTLKAQGIRLHPHILRTETAPLVALSLIQATLCEP